MLVTKMRPQIHKDFCVCMKLKYFFHCFKKKTFSVNVFHDHFCLNFICKRKKQVEILLYKSNLL